MPKKRSKAQISYNMSRIKGKDTSIELILRKALYAKGYRYHKNDKSLPGHPDIVLSKYRIVIFCDGDFFHGYDYDKTSKSLHSHIPYWQNKIQMNRKRDVITDERLVEKGYLVLRFWEHEIKENLNQVLAEIDDAVLRRTMDSAKKI
jgi:DNA mismatch endonuclease (patch repair protein)